MIASCASWDITSVHLDVPTSQRVGGTHFLYHGETAAPMVGLGCVGADGALINDMIRPQLSLCWFFGM